MRRGPTPRKTAPSYATLECAARAAQVRGTVAAALGAVLTLELFLRLLGSAPIS